MTAVKHKDLTNDPLELVAERFRVLGEANRLRLANALRSGELSVTELVTLTGLTQANVSRHLSALTMAGFLGRRKEGLKVLYFVVDPSLFDVCLIISAGLEKKASFAARTSPDLQPQVSAPMKVKKAVSKPLPSSTSKEFTKEKDTPVATSSASAPFEVSFD